MNKPKLSLCMIVKNEEKFLPGCLESVKNIADEIIIVDTGSTDKTIEIARRYNAKIFHLDWKNDFSIARNESIKHSTGEWILVLDADERLNPNQETKLKKYLNSNFDALYVKVINLGKDGKPDVINEYPRLFRKKDWIKFEGRIHEQITPSILRNCGKIAKTDITITHLGYAQSDEIMSKKYERNLNLLLEEIKENPDNAYAYYHIGIIKILTGEKENGIEWLKKAISIQKEKSNLGDSLLASIYNIIGKYELQNERYQEAIDYFVKSSKLAPTQLTSYYLSGIAHAKLSNFHIAKNFFEIALKNLKAISNGKSLDVSLENMVEENEIHFKLMICYFKLGNYQRMKEHLLKVIHDEILYKATIDFLVEEYKLGVGNAINVLKEISTIKPSFEIFKILSGIYQINGELEDAVKNLEIALNFKDDDDEIRYNLGMCLVGLRRFDEAIRVLSDFKVRENSKFFDASIKVLALAHIGCGNFEEALKCYEILLNHNPNDEAIKTKARTLAQKLNLRFSERIY